MEKTIAVIRGDGIGPEIVEQAIAVFRHGGQEIRPQLLLYRGAQRRLRHRRVRRAAAGELPELLCQRQCAARRGRRPEGDAQPPENRPEKGSLSAAHELLTATSARRTCSGACERRPLRADIAAKGVDFVVVRELIGGVYFGEHTLYEKNGEPAAQDIMPYTEHEIRRIAHVAFQTARTPQDRDVRRQGERLATSRLWRKTVSAGGGVSGRGAVPHVCRQRVHADDPRPEPVRRDRDGEPLRRHPLRRGQPDHRLCRHDPSSSMGDGTRGLYEPIHGSAPDIAGQDKANPIGTILAAAMMLRYSFDVAAEADAVEGGREPRAAGGLSLRRYHAARREARRLPRDGPADLRADNSHKKGGAFLWRDSLRTAYFCALRARKCTLSAQSVFCGVHAAAKTDWGFSRPPSRELCETFNSTGAGATP